jgi:hypothetical protein
MIIKSYTLSLLGMVAISKVTFTILNTVNALAQYYFPLVANIFREKETKFRGKHDTFRKCFRFRANP